MLKNKIAAAGMAGMLAMSLGLVACGGNNSAASAASTAEAASTEAATTATESTAEASSADSAAATELAQAALYYEGTLADGALVTLSEDTESGINTLIITAADLSDIKIWAGTSSTDSEGKATITDAESNETISYTISSVDAEGATIVIDGYGEVALKGVTEAEFEKQLDEADQLLEQLDGAISEAAADEAAAAEASSTSAE